MAILSEVQPEPEASELENLANKAALDGVLGCHKYEEAVDLYSRAIAKDPKNAIFYARRSAVQFHLGNYPDAISDGKKATELNSTATLGCYWSGEAFCHMEEYASAKAAFMAAKPSSPEEQATFQTCISKCNAELELEGHPVAMDTEPEDTPLTSRVTGDSVENKEGGGGGDPNANGSSHAVEAPPLYRHDFYNTPTSIVINIYAKGVSAEDLEIDFGEQMLSVVRFASGSKDPIFTLQPRLYAKIIPAESKYEILKTKIEIKLRKADASLTWKTLQFSDAEIVLPPADDGTSSIAKEAVVPYPTSSKKGPAKWDKIEAEVKNEEKEEDMKGQGGPNSLFQMIYKNSDEETRRAMNKSFTESQGTCLSTNWKEVGAAYQSPYDKRDKDKDKF